MGDSKIVYDKAVEQGALQRACEELGLTATDDMMEMLRVFQRAMFIYRDRDATRGDLWRRAGWPENLRNARGKLMRLLPLLDAPSLDPTRLEDDALDLINYVAFHIRNTWHGRREWTL